MYYIIMIGQKAIFLLLLFLCMYVLYLFAKCYRKFVFTDILLSLRPSFVKGKGSIVLIAAVFTVAVALIFSGQVKQTVTVSVTLTYPEASYGLNPNGSRYNMSEIFSDEVLREAISFGGFTDVTVDDLQQSLDISPMEGHGLEDTVSTQFFLTFYNSGHTGNLSGKEILYAVSSAYREWFINEYSANYDVLAISFDNMEKYEYPDRVNALRNVITTICNFASAYAREDSTYRSDSTQETFQSLSEKGWDIYNTGMESLESFVLSRGLSNDQDSYLSKLRYDFTNNCNIYRSNIQAYDVRIEAIEKYDNDMATVVYIPTYDTDNTFYMSKTKIGIDHFSADADAYSGAASEVLSTLQDDKYLMQQLRAEVDDAVSYEKAEGMIMDLQRQILELAQDTKKTVQDYIDSTYNGYISVSEPLGDTMGLLLRILGFGCSFFCIVYVIRAFWLLDRNGRKFLGRDGI